MEDRIKTEKSSKVYKNYLSTLHFHTKKQDIYKMWINLWKFSCSRFAEFVEGSHHLSDDEIEEYDSLSIKPNGTILTDDSDSIAEYSED